MKTVTQELQELLARAHHELDIAGDLPRTIEGLAECLAHPLIADWLIETSKATPYTHLEGYMNRFWVFNPYDPTGSKEGDRGLSGRVHHILRRDLDRHHHDHPWDARTIILRGWYREVRLMPDGSEQEFVRRPGDTATINFGEYHRITEVSEGGVHTLFITEAYQGTWGFLVDGMKVPYKEYLNGGV